MNKKKKKILIISSSLILIIVTITMLHIFLEYNKMPIYDSEIIINVGEKLPSISDYFQEKELVRLDEKVIKWENLVFKEKKILKPGTYKGYVFFHKKRLSLKLIVIDKEAPRLENVKDIEIFVNDEINLLENIIVIDNSLEEITPKVIGDYDIKKAGEYLLNYQAVDSSKNEVKKEFKLIVKEKPVPVVPTIPNDSVIIGTTSKGYKIEKKNGIVYINGILIANKTYALPQNYAPGGLTATTLSAFRELQADARVLGLSLVANSGYRSYFDQRYIYNNYVATDGQANADTYSARAGHSEHQTGLAFDLNSITIDFADTEEGKWVFNNCYRYGFIIRYPKGKESITGYMYEPWHLRYVGKELATSLYNQGNWITLEEYLGITSQYQN